MKKNWFSIRAATGSRPVEIAIYDEIGAWGITARAFYENLRAVAAPDARLSIRINSPGGSVFDGAAIHNILKSHPGHVSVQIDGLAASIASVIAMAGDEITIPENAFIMIHNPSMVAVGGADDFREWADMMEKIREVMAGVYVARTGLPESVILAAMDEETWYTGAEAVQLGFADSLSAPVRLAACSDLSSYQHIPKQISSQFTRWQKPPRNTPAGNAAVDAANSILASIQNIQF